MIHEEVRQRIQGYLGYITPCDVYDRVVDQLRRGSSLILIIDACFSGFWVDYFQARHADLSALPGKITIQSSASDTPSTNVFANAWQELQRDHGRLLNPGAGPAQQVPRLFTTEVHVQDQTGTALKFRGFWFFRDGSTPLLYHGPDRCSILDLVDPM